jgi:hypothetical protein
MATSQGQVLPYKEATKRSEQVKHLWMRESTERSKQVKDLWTRESTIVQHIRQAEQNLKGTT